MADSGMTEDAEYLTMIPKQYLVIRQKRHKYRCTKCHGDIKTAPAPKRIKDGSAYSDEMAIDVAMAKFCDLVPVERYATIAGRAGVKGLPPQSLIEATHNLADFIKAAYHRLKTEVMASAVLNADETPHRMLEGSAKMSWYLWGFSTSKTSYFEIHDTRSGDVASELLTDKNSMCQYLVSDVFSGYAKAVREANRVREPQGRSLIKSSYCNAHARRKFKDALERFGDEAQYFIDQYKEIYRFEGEVKGRPPNEVLKVRKLMEPIFSAMKEKAMADIGGYSSKGSIGKAMSYFLENYEGLTLFLQVAELPIDNNSQERLMRNPVIGRKTWYGTHSERGAETTAVLFSLVESCKLNDINPREYMKKLVQDLHDGRPAFTPSEYKNLPT
jgi:transposase